MREKNLLVTFADSNYIDQAKQLFSGVYWNAGWKGDYMLLSIGLSEKDTEWFEMKGIIVRNVELPVAYDNMNGYPLSLYIVFWLFTSEFKKWKTILYLDTDIIVRGSLDGLLDIQGFAAGYDALDHKLRHQFSKESISISAASLFRNSRVSIPTIELDERIKQLAKKFNLNRPSFNMGLFVFNTAIIKDDSFSRLKNLFYSYGMISAFPPQGELNLFFYDQITVLPEVYNLYPLYYSHYYKIKKNNIKAIILHFPGSNKPWHEGNSYYAEWKFNLDKADDFNLIRQPRPDSAFTMSRKEIDNYRNYILLKKLIHLPFADYKNFLGFLGIKIRLLFLKKNHG